MMDDPLSKCNVKSCLRYEVESESCVIARKSIECSHWQFINKKQPPPEQKEVVRT